MNRVALIIPYFGNFNNYFDLWLQSAEDNANIDFLIITDNKPHRELKDNIKWNITSFDRVRERIQNLEKIKLTLDSPYKLCEFRLSYGHIFEDLLQGYEFWGFCDVDLIFGDFSSFLDDIVLDSYDKFYFRGHLSIYRNNDYFRQLYKSDDGRLPVTYKMAWTTRYTCHFDELFEWNDIIRDAGYRTYENVDYADLRVDKWAFYDAFIDENNQHKIYLKERRKLYCIQAGDGELKRTEKLYVHLQKRKMSVSCDLKSDRYFIIPNRFVNMSEVSVESLTELSKDRFWFDYYKRRIKEIVTNIQDGALVMRYKTFKRRQRRIVDKADL